MTFGAVYGSPVGGLQIMKAAHVPGALDGDISSTTGLTITGTSHSLYNGPIGPTPFASYLLHGVLITFGVSSHIPGSYYSYDLSPEVSIDVYNGSAASMQSGDLRVFDAVHDLVGASVDCGAIWLPATSSDRRWAVTGGGGATLLDLNDASNVTVDAWLRASSGTTRWFPFVPTATVSVTGQFFDIQITVKDGGLTNTGGGTENWSSPTFYIVSTMYPPDVNVITSEDEHQADAVAAKALLGYALPGASEYGYLTNPVDTNVKLTEV